jgi:ribosome-binding protein aMBF1 (putative translation factor)
MANYSRWEDVKKTKGEPSAETRAGVEQDLDLGQLIYDLRTEARLSQRELADRMGTTQSVIFSARRRRRCEEPDRHPRQGCHGARSASRSFVSH